MTRLRNYTFLVLSSLFLMSGCTVFSKKTSTPPIVDPLVERNQQWSEQVEAGNHALQQGISEPRLLLTKPLSQSVQIPTMSSTRSRRYIFNLRSTKTHGTHFSHS